MAAVSVTFDGTRLNDADSNTNWGNFVIGGGAPASEFPLAYQVTSGTTAGAVNKKITSSSARQGVDYNHGSGTDMTAAANKLWFVKAYISDSFDLNTAWGVEVAMGSSDTNNDHRYCIAGTNANLPVYDQYPPQGGYLITAIDPSIDTWRESENGTFDQTSVLWFALGAQFVNGTAKAENVALDSIDIGTGLSLVGGDGADPDGVFTDFVAEDQDDKTNRWGVVTGSADVVRAHGVLTIGSATATVFNDATSIVLFPDGYHSRGLVGVDVDLQSASTTVTIDSLLIGEGTRNGVDANDTRPDFNCTGTSGSGSSAGTWRNFRDFTLSSAFTLDGADVECMLLVQNSADIVNSVIRCNALTSIATLQDPTFGTTTDLRDTEFVQAGAGHAIELDAATTYNMQGLTFTGFNASNGQDDSALDITASTGTVTLELSGMATPSYKTAGATVVVNNNVTVTFSGLQANTEVRVYNNTTGAELDGVENSGASFAAAINAGTVVDYVIHHEQYEYIRVEGFTWPSTATTIPIQQRLDRNYENP